MQQFVVLFFFLSLSLYSYYLHVLANTLNNVLHSAIVFLYDDG